MVELISRPSCSGAGGFESFCLRMEAPSSKVVESMRLQEASSLEGDSLPQTHAGIFKAPTQRDRKKLFSARPMCWSRYLLSRWCAGAAGSSRLGTSGYGRQKQSGGSRCPHRRAVQDCRFLKEEDERLNCFNRFVNPPWKKSTAQQKLKTPAAGTNALRPAKQ